MLFSWGWEEKQRINARSNNPIAGETGYSATVNNMGRVITVFVQKTDLTVRTGELFEVSLSWVKGQNWKPTDFLRLRVFTTSDDTLAGDVIWGASAEFDQAPGQWSRLTQTFGPAPAEANGSILFLSFYGSSPNAEEHPEAVLDDEGKPAKTPGYARVDDVEIRVAQ
jgi:hypothetical protein